MTDIQKGLIKGIIINVSSLCIRNQQLPVVILDNARYQPGDRTLARTAFSNDSSKLTRLKLHIDMLQDSALFIIGKAQITQLNIHCLCFPLLLFCLLLRFVQNTEYFITGCYSIHCNVKEGAQQTQRYKEL